MFPFGEVNIRLYQTATYFPVVFNFSRQENEYYRPAQDKEIMNYQFWFWILVAFLAGRFIPRKVYIGYDEDKYNKSDFGILLRK
jgi:hypothetical protein